MAAYRSSSVAETNGFELFTSEKQLTSYAGYDIVENESGTRKGKTKISKQGNAHIRRILCMPAFNAINVEGVFLNLYNRVFERTKEKMKGYTAVQRKLLCMMYTLWKKDEDFDYSINNKTVEEQNALLH
ncbi:IS110 family transposase [Microscilla marina]|uniref:Transposase for n=1 Tax=Microscilla marina ATCC 23134 TaxID=313606 RepID=A1ZD75_MICM2|nr:IS110 family transposase [Microscilla marina]EAY31614.1 transposase for [Microscilla marina ATCC 23134]